MKKRDVHAERASQEARGGRFLEDKDWEPEAAVGIAYIKIGSVRCVPHERPYSSSCDKIPYKNEPAKVFEAD